MQDGAGTFRAVLFFAVAAQLAACGGSSGGGNTPAPPLHEGWNVIYPGGSTLCSDGSEYAFFVRPGPENSADANKVVFEFEGGGACWNAETCVLKTYKATVDVVATFAELEAGHGIEEFDNPDNPYQNWTHVYIPYCTADVHAGDSTYTYTQGLRIHHNGQNNVRAVLDWSYEKFPTPDQVNVTGCSAGSVGSIIWAPWIFDNYAGASKTPVQFGDSFVGYETEDFFNEALSRWNGWGSFFSGVPAFTYGNINTYRTDYFAWVYIQTAEAFPQATFSQFLSVLDLVETMFCYLGGGGAVPLEIPFGNAIDLYQIGGSCSSPLWCEFSENVQKNQCCIDAHALAGALSSLLPIPADMPCLTLLDIANMVGALAGFTIPPQLVSIVTEISDCNTSMDCLKLPNPFAWNSYMQQYVTEIKAATWPPAGQAGAAALPKNFYAFLSQGACHCTIPNDYFYRAQSMVCTDAGCSSTVQLYLSDWLNALVDGTAPEEYNFAGCKNSFSSGVTGDAMTCVFDALAPCLMTCLKGFTDLACISCLLETTLPEALPGCGNEPTPAPTATPVP